MCKDCAHRGEHVRILKIHTTPHSERETYLYSFDFGAYIFASECEQFQYGVVFSLLCMCIYRIFHGLANDNIRQQQYILHDDES